MAGLLLRHHRNGRAIHAIGGYLEAARAAGIKFDRIRIAVFTIALALAGLIGTVRA